MCKYSIICAFTCTCVQTLNKYMHATSTHKCALPSAHASIITNVHMHIHTCTSKPHIKHMSPHAYIFIHTHVCAHELAYHMVYPCACMCSTFTYMYICIYAAINQPHMPHLHLCACLCISKLRVCSHVCTRMLTHICAYMH